MAGPHRIVLLGRAAVARLREPERFQQIAALVIRVASAGLGYLVLAGAARVTALADFSDFALVMAATAMFGAVATLGQETLLLRRLPLICADGLRGYRRALKHGGAIVACGLLGFAGLAMAYGWHSFTAHSPALLLLVGLLVAGSGACELLFAIQRGSGNVLGAVFRRELVWKLVLAAAVTALLIGHRTVSTTTLAGWYLAGIVATVALFALPIAVLWRRAPRDDGQVAAGGGSAISFFLLNFINQAGTQLDVLVLGLMAGIPAVELGAYYAAQRTIQILYILPYGASITSAPKIPLAWARGDRREIVRLSRQISREVAGVVLVIAILAYVFRVPVMGFFRPEFGAHALVLPVLILGPLASALGGLHNMVAPMCGQETLYARLRLALILGFLALKLAVAASGSLLLFAATGAAEQIAITLAGVILARRKLGFWIV